MTSNFLAIGECMVEMAPTADGTYAMGFAGDTLNTAWYLRKLLPADWQVSYMTAVGQDQVSARMLAFLAEAGIGTDHIRQLPGRTVGLYMIQLSKGERSFAYWRSNSAARLLAADEAFLDRGLLAAKTIYFSGISLAILPPDDRQRLLAALHRARTAGARVAFDPNLRPQLWESGDTMRAMITAAAGACDVVLPSFEDEAVHFGDKSAAKTAERYRSAGAGLAVVKNGPDEILCRDAAGEALYPAETVATIVDTTAAGDSFNAGFLAAYLTGSSQAVSILQASRLAAQVIMKRGALVDVVSA